MREHPDPDYYLENRIFGGSSPLKFSFRILTLRNVEKRNSSKRDARGNLACNWGSL